MDPYLHRSRNKLDFNQTKQIFFYLNIPHACTRLRMNLRQFADLRLLSHLYKAMQQKNPLKKYFTNAKDGVISKCRAIHVVTWSFTFCRSSTGSGRTRRMCEHKQVGTVGVVVGEERVLRVVQGVLGLLVVLEVRPLPWVR